MKMTDKFHQGEKTKAVRLYDGFDYLWIDITGPCTAEEAEKAWNEKTENGTKMTKYSDIDYYKIFDVSHPEFCEYVLRGMR